MKTKVKPAAFLIICFSFFTFNCFSQTITADTSLANQYLALSRAYEINSKVDSAIFFAEKAHLLNIRYLGEKSLKNADVLHLLGRLNYSKNKLDLALEYNLKALQIRKEILSENHLDVANSYHNLGMIYNDKGEICAKSTGTFALFTSDTIKLMGLADDKLVDEIRAVMESN